MDKTLASWNSVLEWITGPEPTNEHSTLRTRQIPARDHRGVLMSERVLPQCPAAECPESAPHDCKACSPACFQ